MKKFNRINNKGLTKQYVLQQLQLALQKKNINNTKKVEDEKDCTLFLSLDIDDFLVECYRELLGREPDNESNASYIRLMCQGMPREAVIYLIVTSQEFAGRFKIKHLDIYKKIYKKYIIKSKIKKLPIIGWYITLRDMPNFITEMRMINVDRHNKIKILNKHIDKKADAINEKADAISQKFDEYADTNNQNIYAINRKADAINDKADAINQKLDAFMELPSVPQYLVVNGILDKNSYLEYANSVLKNTAPEQLVDGNYYQLLEAVFRGSEESIKKHQQYYIDYILSNTEIRKITGKYFLDAGCGRGELLTLLQEQNIASVGIDINKISIDSLNKKGYKAYCVDILEYLNKIDDNELIGLSSFQVIEHLSKEYVSKLIETAYKKIINGGVILLETLNPYCYSNQEWFYIDPTHVSWHSPDNLKLYLEYIGFCEVKVIYSAPVQPQYASKVDMMRNYIQFAVVASVQK
jgi:SAM-dependent methyltransferase